MSQKTLVLHNIATVLTFILGGGSIIMWALAIPSIPDQIPPDARGWMMTISLCASLMSYGAVWPFTLEEFDYGNMIAGFVVCLMSIAVIVAAVIVFIRNFRCPTVGLCKWITVLVIADCAFCVTIMLIQPRLIILGVVCLVFRALVITAEQLLLRSLRADERASR